ncbi:flagellar protein FliT [Bacillus pakistanensis]|uniref:Flagellar protein FliT n=1 Tax=Rossellomorea pakistanensis TaxID=992288 RepID=A0ABS2NE83_9BACI|nr:flagellar protein FliT [Bacillus pakistanensis]MBM7585881.1 flagellar protein FliT [Bacillus pakistanensis]
MSAVQQCYDITKELFILVDKVDSEYRDQVIEKVEALLERRGSLLKSIQAPFPEEEKAQGVQIVRWNTKIDQKLVLLRTDIKRDMNGLNKKKTSVKKYTNPYDSLQFDGMFYDKRK